MTPQDFQTYINHQQLQIQVLQRIADALEMLAPPRAPNYQLPLEQWRNFDWSKIGVVVELSDNYGAAVVSWREMQFTRRSPQNKFGVAVWYSRCVGKNDAGENQYERLVTFKPLSQVAVEPLPQKVQQLAL